MTAAETWECEVTVFRPAKGRLEITLPDRWSGAKMLQSFAHCNVWAPRNAPYCQVSRVHLEAIVTGLLGQYGEITLFTEHFATEICGAACYSARSQALQCTCGGCAARNHGKGAPLRGWRLRSEPNDVIEADGPYLTRRRNLFAYAEMAPTN